MSTSDKQTASSSSDTTLAGLVRRFAVSDCCWFSSVRPDGRAHSVPIWHVWTEGRAYVITEPKSVKVANILSHPAVVMTHPDPMDPIIVEGNARLAPERLHEIAPHFKSKYDWDPSEDAGYGAVIEITPAKLLAWGKHGEGRWDKEALARVVLDGAA